MGRKAVNRIVVAIAAPFAVLLTTAGLGLWVQTRPYARGPAADLAWEPGGKPGIVELRVIDSDGAPVGGTTVWVGNPRDHCRRCRAD